MEKRPKTSYMTMIGLAIIILGIIASFVLAGVYKMQVPYGLYSYRTRYNWYIAIFGSLGSILEGLVYYAIGSILENQERLEHLVISIKKEKNNNNRKNDKPADEDIPEI